MVIDFHVHVGTTHHWTPWVMQFFKENNPFYWERFSEQIGPDDVLAFFRSQGVDHLVLLAEYAPETSGVVTNEFVADFCRDHGELIPFGCLCLYNDVPFEEQSGYALESLGMRGFKALPSYQHFYPNDPMFFPFYDYMQSRGAPIMFHTGTTIFKGSRVKYADPLLLDDVADEFPRLTIIMEHGGRPFWYDRAAWLVTRHANVHIGIAGMPVRKLPEIFPQMERFQDRFLFGSDWPGMADVKGLIDRVRRLPLSLEAKEKILGGNARRILGLP